MSAIETESKRRAFFTFEVVAILLVFAILGVAALKLIYDLLTEKESRHLALAAFLSIILYVNAAVSLIKNGYEFVNKISKDRPDGVERFDGKVSRGAALGLFLVLTIIGLYAGQDYYFDFSRRLEQARQRRIDWSTSNAQLGAMDARVESGPEKYHVCTADERSNMDKQANGVRDSLDQYFRRGHFLLPEEKEAIKEACAFMQRVPSLCTKIKEPHLCCGELLRLKEQYLGPGADRRAWVTQYCPLP